MDQQENKQSSVEDLTVTQDEASDVKGGIDIPTYLKGTEGDSTAAGGPVHGGWDLQKNVKC